MPSLKRLGHFVAVVAAFVIAGSFLWAQELASSDDAQVVMMTRIEGPIGPATVRHIERVIALAGERKPAALVLQLNTPGGLADAMREIITEVLASPVPVIGYVAPSGGHAASAGTYILYAAHVAAMAPGTNLGAATPVQIGGLPDGLPISERDEEEAGSGADPVTPSDSMSAKATNDAVALIRSLAELRGRNADWAEKAVREAASLSANAALEANVIDLVATNVDELLAAADGRVVEVVGTEHIIKVAGLPVETVEMNATTRLLSVLSNPNVALILMLVGIYGLIFEFWNPGSVGPGVIGGICLVVGLYALNQLPLDYAGLALIGLGIAFMVVEAMTPTFGIFGFGGLVAFVIGASMLVDTDAPAYQISWGVIGTMAAISGAVLVLLLGFTARSYRSLPVSGQARMRGEMAQVVEWSGTEGYVWTEGERWRARGVAGLTAGQAVRVRDVDGLTLRVDAVSDDALQPDKED